MLVDFNHEQFPEFSSQTSSRAVHRISVNLYNNYAASVDHSDNYNEFLVIGIEGLRETGKIMIAMKFGS